MKEALNNDLIHGNTMEQNQMMTLESGSLPIDESCEFTRFYDLLGEPSQLVIMGKGTNEQESTKFNYSRLQIDAKTFDSSTYNEMIPIDVCTDLLIELGKEFGVDPMTTISCVEQMLLKRELEGTIWPNKGCQGFIFYNTSRGMEFRFKLLLACEIC